MGEATHSARLSLNCPNRYPGEARATWVEREEKKSGWTVAARL